jgi:hypothetical protein
VAHRTREERRSKQRAASGSGSSVPESKSGRRKIDERDAKRSVRNGSSKSSVPGAHQSRDTRERKKSARNRFPVPGAEHASAHSRDSRKKHQKQRDNVRRLEVKQNVLNTAGNDDRVQEQVNSPVAIEAVAVDEEAEENERSRTLEQPNEELAQPTQQMIQKIAFQSHLEIISRAPT